jgi:hypothetical protein
LVGRAALRATKTTASFANRSHIPMMKGRLRLPLLCVGSGRNLLPPLPKRSPAAATAMGRGSPKDKD